MTLSWFGIARLGLVQTALGAIVVLATSTLNRVMNVELGLAAAIPGALFAWHYGVQITRPHWGHGSDAGGRRTPFILGGMAVLALGGTGAALGVLVIGQNFWAGIALSTLAYAMIGLGVGAAGTSLLALLATHVAPRRRGAAAAAVWMMMIAGFVVTTIAVGAVLDPYTPGRLVVIVGCVCAIAMALATAAVWGVEGAARASRDGPSPRFAAVLREVWSDASARAFTIFVFVSMLAYSAQDLILEPFAGRVYGMSAGETTALAGAQHAGTLAGMVLVGVCVSGFGIGTLRAWTIGGCAASAAALAMLATAGPGAPLPVIVATLGLANGAFAVAAIGMMMALAGAGGPGRTGTRMGLWGAAQAVAFGLGGLTGAAAVDVARALMPDDATAFGTVFLAEAALFLIAAGLAARLHPTPRSGPVLVAGE